MPALIVIVILLLIVSIYLFLQHPRFGALPKGARLLRIQQSPQFRGGQFQNEHLTPSLTEGATTFSVMKKFFFGKNPNGSPSFVVPSVKTDLHAFDPRQNVLVWFGHSSYFLQVDGKRILVDPVFGKTASPLRFTTRRFPGTEIYNAEDIPAIDYLFISHDHWDHLDYRTMLSIDSRVGKIITGLGVGAHFERWGFDMAKVIETDWHEHTLPDPGFEVHTLPARHFSGRSLTRNRSLWVSFALTTPTKKIYLGGDSGYDTHFADIGKKFGPFDLAILECGQYNLHWKYIHMLPEEVTQAAIDLRAQRLLPVHWGKFLLSLHDWNEPVELLSRLGQEKNISLITPVIGEIVDLDNATQKFSAWWRENGNTINE